MIILMSIALIGITIIQYLWIKRSVDLKQRNFDDKVLIAMGQVRENLFQDAQQAEYYAKFWRENVNRKKPITGSMIQRPSLNLNSQDNNELLSTMIMINPDKFLSNIKPKVLEKYIKTAIQEQRIDLRFDYGIFDNTSESFYIYNGHYQADFGNTGESSTLDTDNNLYNSPHVINLSLNDENGAGKLVLYFPQREASSWRAVLANLMTSLLFTGLILFCFIYTLYIILRQKKVSEMKTDFINNMTHEFKTPIATISLASDSIPMVIKDEDKVKKFINIIRQENQRMLRQVEKVLQISKAEKQDFQLNIVDVNINEVANTASENIELIIQSQNGKITRKFEAENPLIEADQTHVSNVIHNLLDNAAKYSEGATEITLITRNVKDGVEISVSDKGIGMNKESLKYIFDKFFRVHTGNRHDVKGFGLGLSYVKSMVDKHNGTVRVKSELGKGSTFTVFLPFKHKV